MLKFCKLLIALLVACMLTTACSKPQVEKKAAIAVVDIEQAIKVHALYPEYKKSEQLIETLEQTRSKQQEIAKKQMSGLDAIISKGVENRDNFNQAMMVAKMTEMEALAKIELKEIQEKVKKELQPDFEKREQGIREYYKVPIFNLRAKLSIVKLKPEERDKLLEELNVLETEQLQRLNEVEREKMTIVRARTQNQEMAIIKRLSETASGTYQKMINGSNTQAADMDDKMGKLAEEWQKTLFNLQQEIDNQKNKQDLIYQKMYQDLEAAAGKIAQAKGYEIVMRDVKVNINAIDITQEIKEELVKYSSK